jgi:putative NADH-flavin reductase
VVARRHILVLGATGGTGREVVSQALDLGDLVTVFVRDPQRLTTNDERLRVRSGSITEGGPALADAVHGQDAVISALGAGKSLRSGGLIAHAVPRLVAAMQSERVRRLVFTSAYGVGATRQHLPLVPRILASLLLRDLYKDKQAGEEQLRRSDLDWTLVYPVTLTNHPPSGRYRAGEHLSLRGLPTVSRADVAAFLLKQIDDRQYLRRGVLISS